MAAGASIISFGTPTWNSFSNRGGGAYGGGGNAGGGSLAVAVLRSFGLTVNGTAGSDLPGYDVKSHDAIAVLKLSLIASSDGSSFTEPYCDAFGVVQFVTGGTGGGGSLGRSIARSTFRDMNTPPPVVVVQSKDPLPERIDSESVALTDGALSLPSVPCGFGGGGAAMNLAGWTGTHDPTLDEDFLAERLKGLVHRSQWEELIAYKTHINLGGSSEYLSLSVSQTMPILVNVGAPNAGRAGTFAFGPGSNLTDVGGCTTVGYPCIDVVRGSELFDMFSQILAPIYGSPYEGQRFGSGWGENDPTLWYPPTWTQTDYYCMMDDRCQVCGLGENVNYATGGGMILTMQNGGSAVGWDAFASSFGENAGNLYMFQRSYVETLEGGSYSLDNVASLLQETLALYLRPGYENVRASEWTMDMFDFPFLTQNVLWTSPLASPAVGMPRPTPGIGPGHGFSIKSCTAGATIQRPCMQVQSLGGDAHSVAGALAQGGVSMSAIKYVDKPPLTAICRQGGGCTQWEPTPPPDEETDEWNPTDPLDEISDAVIEIGAGWLSREEVMSFASNYAAGLASDEGRTYETAVSADIAPEFLPNMGFGGGAVASVEHSYADKDSMSTSITSGPVYMPIGSYSESTYVKKSVTVSRKGTIVGGSNSSGNFFVYFRGLGEYQCFNTTMDSMFPGDHVEVTIHNFPVEKD